VPPSRDEHTAVIYEESMIIYGGFEDGIRTNSIYRYYFRENKWEKINILSTNFPSPRAGHSSIMFGEKMAIFGGRDDENNKLNDIWLFDFSTYAWEYEECEHAPIARAGHTASLYKDMMIIFGGIIEVTKELDDMQIYDFRNKRWIEFFEECSSPIKLRDSLVGLD
jgi:N-acetylneuraminic acid mutarotase